MLPADSEASEQILCTNDVGSIGALVLKNKTWWCQNVIVIVIAERAIDCTTLDINFDWLERGFLASSFNAFYLSANLCLDVDLTAFADLLVFVSRISVYFRRILTEDGVNTDVVS